MRSTGELHQQIVSGYALQNELTFEFYIQQEKASGKLLISV
jgi:hypothetical protein